MVGSSTGGNNGPAGKGRSRKKKADRSTLNTAQVVTRSIAAASTARRVITSTDSDQSTKGQKKQTALATAPSEVPLTSLEDNVNDKKKVTLPFTNTSPPSPQESTVPPALEENNDDTNDKVVALQEDGSPTAPADNNGPVLTQSEVDDKEETVKAPHYSLPEHSGEASADVQALALSSSEREKVMKQELTESSCDENLGEFSDEMSQFSFVSSHRTAIPGDEDYESNSNDAALSLDSNATDYTCKGRSQASYTILDLPPQLVQGDQAYTERNWHVGRLHRRIEGSNTLKKSDFDDDISSEEANYILWNSQSEIRYVLGTRQNRPQCRDKDLELLGSQIGFLERKGIGAKIDALEERRAEKARQELGCGTTGAVAQSDMPDKEPAAARRKAGLGEEELNDYWDPAAETRKRKPNIGLSAEQVHLKEQRKMRADLKVVFTSDNPIQHKEVFSNLLSRSASLLQAPRQDEHGRHVASRLKKATTQYQKRTQPVL